MLPAHAGVIPLEVFSIFAKLHVTRTRGGDPRLQNVLSVFGKMLPAHAGVILNSGFAYRATCYVTRTRGGDPSFSFLRHNPF